MSQRVWCHRWFHNHYAAPIVFVNYWLDIKPFEGYYDRHSELWCPENRLNLLLLYLHTWDMAQVLTEYSLWLPIRALILFNFGLNQSTALSEFLEMCL